MYAMKVSDEWQIIASPFVIEGQRYDWNWPDRATPEERLAFGIRHVVEDFEVPIGHRVIQRIFVEREDDLLLCNETVEMYPADAAQKIWLKIKAERERRIGLGAPTPLGTMDADDSARINVGGAVQMAQILGSGFAIEWTLHDNTLVTLNAQQMIQAGMMVGQYYSAQHRRSQQMRNELASLTVPEMYAKDIPTWWDEV